MLNLITEKAMTTNQLAAAEKYIQASGSPDSPETLLSDYMHMEGSEEGFEAYLEEMAKEDSEFVNYVNELERHEPVLNNPGFRSCQCEDYPCCGH